MSDLGDATNWTDREREFFAAGWNECVKMQPGENGRLRAALKGIVDTWDAEDHPVPMPNLRRAIEAARVLQQATPPTERT